MRSAGQNKFYGLIRSLQSGKRPLNTVDARAQQAAMRMPPEDLREALPVKRSALDLLGYVRLMQKSADAQRLSQGVRKVEQAVKQLGEQRRRSLEQNLKTVNGHLERERAKGKQLETKFKEQAQGQEERKLELELEAQERRHQQQLRHEHEKAELQMHRDDRKAEMDQIRMQQQMEQAQAATQPQGPEAPTGQVPYGAMTQPAEEA